jgi:hypothetical protein
VDVYTIKPIFGDFLEDLEARRMKWQRGVGKLLQVLAKCQVFISMGKRTSCTVFIAPSFLHSMPHRLQILKWRLIRPAIFHASQEMLPLQLKVLIIIFRFPTLLFKYQALKRSTPFHLF